MKEKEVKYTVRLYDIDTIDQLQEVLDNDVKDYGNKNKVLTEIIQIGLQGYHKKDSETTTNDTNTQISNQQLIDLENTMLRFCSDLKTEIIQGNKMLSCIFHMMSNNSLGLSTELLGNGFYDEMPILDDIV